MFNPEARVQPGIPHYWPAFRSQNTVTTGARGNIQNVFLPNVHLLN